MNRVASSLVGIRYTLAGLDYRSLIIAAFIPMIKEVGESVDHFFHVSDWAQSLMEMREGHMISCLSRRHKSNVLVLREARF